MSRFCVPALLEITFALMASCGWAGETPAIAGKAKPRVFGIMPNSDDMRRTPATQLASTMKTIGYTNVAISCAPEQFDSMVKAYRDAGIQVGAVYVGWTTDGKSGSFNIPINTVFDRLRDTDAIVMLHTHVAKGAKADDQQIVGQLKQLARQAKRAGVTVAIYPHFGFRLATLEQATRIANAVDHPSLGVCFNLCHFLKQNDARELPAQLRAAKHRIKLVTINGAGEGDTQSMGWDKLIQPINHGEFDLEKLLELVCVQLQFKGPIFVQCYNLKAPARTILQETFDQWQYLKRALPAM